MLTPQEVSTHVFSKARMGGYNMAMVDEFLDTLSIRTTSGLRVSDATIRKIRSIAVDRGFIKSAEVSDG